MKAIESWNWLMPGFSRINSGEGQYNITCPPPRVVLLISLITIRLWLKFGCLSSGRLISGFSRINSGEGQYNIHAPHPGLSS